MMKTNKNLPKRLSIWAFVVAGILMIPLIGRAPWTGLDFSFAGGVLFSSACIYEIATRNMRNSKHRMAVGFGVMMVILLIWAWAVA